MMIKTEQDIALFEQAVNCCRRAVWLVTPNGTQLNLKNTQERYSGIAMLLKTDMARWKSSPHVRKMR